MFLKVKKNWKMSSKRPDKLLIDADYLIYAIGFTCEDVSERTAKNRLVETLENLVYVHLKADSYEAFLTGKGNFRYDIAKTVPYKGNRKDTAKPPYYQELRDHMVKRLGAVVVEGQEADDEVAIRMSKEPDTYTLVGVDKDLLQIPGWHFNPSKDLERYVNDFDAYYSFCTQLLTGDRTDNIPGLQGIGPKKAEKSLKDAKTKEELLQTVFEKYQEFGHTIEYFTEQGQLLWLRRSEGEIWQPNVA
jgi:hypothetical protein